MLRYGVFLFLAFCCLSGCEWVSHKLKIQMEIEDVIVEAAKEEIELSKELADKELKK